MTQQYPPQQPGQPFPPPSPPPKRKRHIFRNTLIGVGAFIVVIIIIAVATSGGGSNGKNASNIHSATFAAPSPSPSTASSAATSSAAPSSSPVPSSSAPPPPTTTVKPKPKPPAKPVVYSGDGDDVITVHKPSSGPTIVRATYTGGDNFTIGTADSSQLLVNTIGAYQGVTLLDPDNGDNTRTLQVHASGHWTVSLLPLTSAQRYTGGTLHGDGDLVFAIAASKSEATFASSSQQQNFSVNEYGSDFPNLLVNEIVPPTYHGTVALTTPAIYVVTATGPWTMIAS